GYGLKDLPGGGEQLVSSLVATAINEARHLDPEELDWEIQAAVTRLNSQASKTVQSEYASTQDSLSTQTELPDEMIRQIQSYLPYRDLGAMRCVDKKHSTFDASEVDKAKALEGRAADISSPEEFTTLLDDIQKLPPGYRQEPLTALARRVPMLLAPNWRAVSDSALIQKMPKAIECIQVFLEKYVVPLEIAIVQLNEADRVKPRTALQDARGNQFAKLNNMNRITNPFG
ncbi:F-box protein, partial [Caballeronia sp. EK]|uniref:F-box protein n=1 Tax=Caballeronia sp. EK TaxID=2767469 RepID=UPI00165532F9